MTSFGSVHTNRAYAPSANEWRAASLATLPRAESSADELPNGECRDKVTGFGDLSAQEQGLVVSQTLMTNGQVVGSPKLCSDVPPSEHDRSVDPVEGMHPDGGSLGPKLREQPRGGHIDVYG